MNNKGGMRRLSFLYGLGRDAIISIVCVLFAILLWFITTSLGWIKPLFLPSPQEIAFTFWDLAYEGYRQVPLHIHTVVSLVRALVAFFVSVVIGIPLGLLMGFFPALNAAIDPFVEFFRPLPKLALIPLVVLWFGIGEVAKFVLIFTATVLTIIVSAAAAVRGVPESRIRIARALELTQYQFFRHVIFPSVLPDLFTGVRVGVGIGWTTLIAAEMIAATSGVGWMVLNASAYLRTDIVLLGIVILGVTGYILDIAIVIIQNRVVPWMGKG